jgi:hypothetical protein
MWHYYTVLDRTIGDQRMLLALEITFKMTDLFLVGLTEYMRAHWQCGQRNKEGMGAK